MKFLSKLGFMLLGIGMFALFFIVGASATQTLPKLILAATSVSNWEYKPQDQTTIYYSNGQVMERLGYKRIYKSDYPEFLKDTVVAVEDKRFYSHSSVDARGIARAIYDNIKLGRKAEGGSTITQQLARTLFLNQQKSYTRKIKEVFYATALEAKYSKSAILNMYLNEIYMGRGCSGMACAAESYFGQDVDSLDKAQITMLVGMIQAPEYYSPDRNMTAVKERQAVVVNLLVEQGLITSSEGGAIEQEKLDIKAYDANQTAHPYFISYLVSYLEQSISAQKLYNGGLKIYTTIDEKMQKAAEKAIKDQAAVLIRRGVTAHDMALVSIAPSNGAIRAMVGGVDFNKNQNNMAVLPRQPGSSIKPLYYAAAMDEGIISPDTALNNKPRSFNGYLPHNMESSPSRVSVRDALVHSYNVASVEVLSQLGVDTAIQYLINYGVTTVDADKDNNLALALGGMTRGISPLQLASAYTVFANGGERWSYYAVEKVVASDGNVLLTGNPHSSKVISSNSADLMNDILEDVVKYGTGTPARIGVTSAGKTGTTTDSRDLWYVGYTKELVTAVWAGNSDATPVSGYATYGGSVAAPAWKNYMTSLLDDNVLKERRTQTTTPVVESNPVDQTPTQTDQTDQTDTTGTTPTDNNGQATTTPGEQPTTPSTGQTGGNSTSGQGQTTPPAAQTPVTQTTGPVSQ